MKLSQTLLPVLATISLASTPACSVKPEITDSERRLCGISLDYAEMAISDASNMGLTPVPLETAVEHESRLYDLVQAIRKEIIIGEEMLTRNCDERFDTKGTLSSTCIGPNCDETIAQIKDQVGAISASLKKKLY